MNQKRILWIVAAVGLFLLVVIGFALILYTPTQKQEPIISTIQSTNDVWSSPQNATPINPELHNQDFLLPSDNIELVNSENKSLEIPSQNNQTIAQNSTTSPNNVQQIQDLSVISNNTKVISNGAITIDLTNSNVSTKLPVVITNNDQIASETNYSTPKASSQNSNKTVSTQSSKKQTVTKSKEKTTTPKKTEVTSVATPAKFWIQAASYSSKKNAQEAQEAFAAEKISAQIFTYSDAKGTLFYRVRVGPYTTKSEAEYWQKRIALIERFASTKTYISDSSAKVK